MKRIITSILMIAALMILCVGCGKGKDVSGTYKLSSMGGTSVADLQKQYDEIGMNVNVADMFTMELKSDGTFTMIYGGESESGTYKVDGSKISMTIENDTEEGTVSGNTITLGSGDEEMVFKK
ncbi:MAG: DUF4923 family protein [Lachnospiraceae bacterium]|nr:DUF4923 family protein [Lachnospiraceae bacterium]